LTHPSGHVIRLYTSPLPQLPVPLLSSIRLHPACLYYYSFSRNPDQCSLQLSGASLKQVEKFKYIGVVFTSDGRQNEKLDTRMGKASAVMRALQYSAVMKRELSKKEKLSVFKTLFVPILTYDRMNLG